MTIKKFFSLLPFLVKFHLITTSEELNNNIVPPEIIAGIAAHAGACNWGSIYYDVLQSLIRQHNYKNILEVGVALGGHAETLLSNTNIEKYFGIDPYLYNYDSGDTFSHTVGAYSNRPPQENCDYLYMWVKNYRLSKFGLRCQLIRATSMDAAVLFEDASLDCIFIDGDHRFSAVLQDLELWWPKLKPGGLIAGDDYWMPSVATAVNQFFSTLKIDLILFISNANYKIWGVYKNNPYRCINLT